MYNSLKKIATSVIPKSFLFKNELLFRKLFSFKYRGDTYTCNVCKTGLKKFISIGKRDLLCPICGSRSRSRRVYHILESYQLLSGSILHFSPPRALYRLFKKNTSITYIATDFENEFIADHSYDITNINLPNNAVDMIICYHVLEHITEDTKAMRELYRILKPGGTALIQTPFKEGAIYEDDSITTEEGRLKAFGQKDHVRVYSLQGLADRLETTGFTTNVIAFESKENHQNGWIPENVIKATK